jgi:hypothetical protein
MIFTSKLAGTTRTFANSTPTPKILDMHVLLRKSNSNAFASDATLQPKVIIDSESCSTQWSSTT